jgi:hypothetical protein
MTRPSDTFYSNLEKITSSQEEENPILAIPPAKTNGAHAALAAGVK